MDTYDGDDHIITTEKKVHCSMEEDEFLSPATDPEDSYNNKNTSRKKHNATIKKGGGSGSGGSGAGSMKCCQAEKCAADLGDAKQYHRRHKVCEFHAKAQVVVVGGLRQRFCQQCSRFHELSEFDETKRSCRRRLDGHNARRRKNSTDSPYQSTDQGSTRKGVATAGGSGGGSGGTATTTTTPTTTHQMNEMMCGQVDDRGRMQVLNIQENAGYQHFQIR